MDYLEFVENMKQTMEELLPEHEIGIRKVLKNNGVRLTGITIATKDTQAVPTIYLESFYEDHKNGSPVGEIAERIRDIYLENTREESIRVDFLSEGYEKIRPKLFLKAINRERNEELLREAVHEDFLDLALVPYILIDSSDQGYASAVVNNQLPEMWNVSSDTLLSDAAKNMEETFPYEIVPILTLLSSMMKDTIPKEMQELPDLPMYVLMPRHRNFGAALMAFDSVMEEVGRLFASDFYVLPSSVHELIVVPCDDQRKIGELNEMVKSVNETTVSREEVLSDHAYLYRRGVGYAV